MFIAPTTVLSHQHYVNIKARFEDLGIKVALVNRFVGTKQSKEVLSSFKDGGVDLLIGTHRLLSKDIQPKKLGLFIIDEEQRFGVEHKEKIKALNPSVDILTLTATPIPRSLNLAILGLKDVSVIMTAPSERLPIQTFYLNHSEEVIQNAIRKEYRSWGASFFVHNRVETIDAMGNFISGLVPEAKVKVAHGRQKRKGVRKKHNRFSGW